jgi:hypothetical protein
MARWVSDIFIWIGVLGGIALGATVAEDDVVWGFSLGFGILIQLLALALVLRLLADIADGVWRN